MLEQSKNIVNRLSEKATVKQAVYRNCLSHFKNLKDVLKATAKLLNEQINDQHIEVSYLDKGPFEAHLKFSGDTLIFHMHTNTFSFDKEHHVWKSKYVKENPNRAYCGLISVYNFLSDSLKHHRENDLGFLITRLFINKEHHFFTDGHGKMSFLYNDFANAQLNKEVLSQMLNEWMLFAIDFELQAPPFQDIPPVSVLQIHELSKKMQLKTAKRLGFKFSHEK